MIYDELQWLPQESYPDDEVELRSNDVYQYVFASYRGYNTSNFAKYL